MKQQPATMTYTVFYRRSRTGGTHLPVATVIFTLPDDEQPCPPHFLLEHIFGYMNHQPHEADVRIDFKFNEKSLRSMSVGDRVQYEDGEMWNVASSGFEPVLPDWTD